MRPDERATWRASGFEARGWAEGSLVEHHRALRMRWEIEDRAREHRAWRWQAAARVPAVTWLVLLVFVVGLVATVAAWVAAHPILTGACAGLFALVCLQRRPSPRTPVTVEPIAPPDQHRRPIAARLDPLSTPMTRETRAVMDALDAGRGRLYLDALTRGLVPAPTTTTTTGRQIIAAPLPGGRITADDVDPARVASGLGVDASRVRRGPEVPGVLVLEVLDVAPADLPVPSWPALGAVTDWTQPMPLGVDEVGEPVTVPLAGRRVLVAGMSGSGKTRLIRTFALWAAGDPGVELHVLDLKRSPALACLRERATWWHAGPATAGVVAHLRGLVDEMHARYAAGVPASLPWVVLVIDEAQGLWRERGAAAVVEELARMGREARIGLVIGSQTPDRNSVPTTIAGEADVRIALRLSSTWAPGLVLGEWDRDCAALPPGHAWIVTPDGRVRRVAAHDVDDEDAAEHLHALPALPPAPPPPTDDLAEVLAVMGDRSGIGWDALADALDRDPDDLRARLREVGIKSASVRLPGEGGTARGVRRADIEAALAA